MMSADLLEHQSSICRNLFNQEQGSSRPQEKDLNPHHTYSMNMAKENSKINKQNNPPLLKTNTILITIN